MKKEKKRKKEEEEDTELLSVAMALVPETRLFRSFFFLSFCLLGFFLRGASFFSCSICAVHIRMLIVVQQQQKKNTTPRCSKMNTLLTSRMAHLPPSFPSIFFFFGAFFCSCFVFPFVFVFVVFLMLLMGVFIPC